MFTGALPAVSNRETLNFVVEVFDDDTGEAFDITGSTVTVAIRAQNAALPLLQGSSSDGHVLLTGSSTITVTFPVAEMMQLVAGQYDLGLTILLLAGTTRQLLVVVLPVVDGVVQ